jgi:hypothetical protein
MKFLRNPIVTGILAVVAVMVVAYQFMGSNIRFNFRGKTAQVVRAIAPTLAPAPAPASVVAPSNLVAETSGPVAEATIDRAYLEARFAKWVASPQRDPFLLFGADPKLNGKDDEEFASPISKWKLNGIWDQTGGKLAVINKRVHRVGDEIEGYKIVRIEGEEVWFQGPKRKERLALERRGPSVLQNPVFQPPSNQPPAEADTSNP